MTGIIWHVKLKSGVEFPFLNTTRQDITVDELHNMMPKRGIGYLIPVIGDVPAVAGVVAEFLQGRWFVYVDQSDIVEMWYEKGEPPAQHISFYDKIQASTTEST